MFFHGLLRQGLAKTVEDRVRNFKYKHLQKQSAPVQYRHRYGYAVDGVNYPAENCGIRNSLLAVDSVLGNYCLEQLSKKNYDIQQCVHCKFTFESEHCTLK